jgi:transcriptional regulator with XRE-family HTH domain
MTQKALRALTPSLRQVAEETGLSYSTLKAWSAGERTPRGDHLARIAEYLEGRAGELRELATALRREAGK